jgi:tRNA-uridine 2-sulfurtransferase
MRKSVLVAISGGVDSAVASLLLKQKGFDVTAIHFNLYPNKSQDKVRTILKSIVDRLSIPLIELDLSQVFKNTVLDYFSSEYLNGRTPCPCSYCNLSIKWKFLYDYAIDKAYNFIATGHYVKICELNGTHRVQKGSDIAKDQSYFLWNLPSNFLAKAILPLGELQKSEVKAIASRNGFDDLVNKPESMGICFLKGMDYRTFINGYSQGNNETGPIIDINGKILGTHNGLHQFTIGQKRGLDAKHKGLCVTLIDKENNTIVLGSWDSLYFNTLKLYNCNFPGLMTGKYEGLNAHIRGFGKNPKEKCNIMLDDKGEAIVELSDPAWAPSPGQPTVIYRDDILLGGGYLKDVWNR